MLQNSEHYYEFKKRDKKHLWHPLTQHKTHPEALAIKKAFKLLIRRL